MKTFPLLDNLSTTHFLRNYWHKKPLLMRQAFPGFTPLLSKEALFALAQRDDVESRLVTHFQQQWQLNHGPIQDLPAPHQPGWTLLVQGVNLHNDCADKLLRQFRFIPDTRLDDLMISYASDQGGVGPHIDSYDVFLLQAEGQRSWKIGPARDVTLVEEQPLKILKNFQAEQEYILEPGDMLYLPPQYAHEGTAIGPCMTYSIGFRAAPFQELGEAFLQFMADSIALPGRYADPDLKMSRYPAQISASMVTQITHAFNKIRFTEKDILVFLGEYLSEPKSYSFFEPPTKPLSITRFRNALRKNGIRLSRKTKMLYRNKYIFINGESFALKQNDKTALFLLANQRHLDSKTPISEDVLEALYTWYEDGWIILEE